jgi:hypothetical protein
MRRKVVLFMMLYNSAVLGQTEERGSKDETLLKALTVINLAATQYYSWLKHTPKNLRQLGPRKEGQAVADREAADLLPLELSNGIVGGYKFTLVSSKTGWIITATPIMCGNEQTICTAYKIETSVPR